MFEVEWSGVEDEGDWQYVNECFEKAGIRWGVGAFWWCQTQSDF